MTSWPAVDECPAFPRHWVFWTSCLKLHWSRGPGLLSATARLPHLPWLQTGLVLFASQSDTGKGPAPCRHEAHSSARHLLRPVSDGLLLSRASLTGSAKPCLCREGSRTAPVRPSPEHHPGRAMCLLVLSACSLEPESRGFLRALGTLTPGSLRTGAWKACLLRSAGAALRTRCAPATWRLSRRRPAPLLAG